MSNYYIFYDYITYLFFKRIKINGYPTDRDVGTVNKKYVDTTLSWTNFYCLKFYNDSFLECKFVLEMIYIVKVLRTK